MAAGHEWCRRSPGRGDIPSLALWTPTWIIPRCGSRSGRRTPFPAAARLVFVLWILALVSGFFFLRKTFPVVFDLLGFLSPQLTNYL